MSMLSHQADELRETADRLDRIADVSTPWIHAKLTPMLREAADTIISLRNRLQESERHNRINLEVIGEMYHPEIVELMQECHATRANYEHCKYSANRGWRDTSRYSELFGTPERAVQTLETVAEALYASAWADDNATLSDVLCSLTAHCKECPAKSAPGRGVSTRCGAVDYEMMLEWLRSDA